MNEKPKSIWQKSLFGWRGCLVFCGATFVVTMVIGAAVAMKSDAAMLAGVLSGLAFLLWLLLTAYRWVFRPGNAKRLFFGFACFSTFIALLYAEENWRGKHDWEKFQRKWKAKGVDFEWASVIPAPVPDDQNFALTPIVASCYEMYFDKTGHEVKPRNTNVVDRFSIISGRDISYEHQRPNVPESAGWMAAETIDLKAWQAFFRSLPAPSSTQSNSFPIAPQPQRPPDDVLLALSKYDSVIEEIRQASRLPHSRFPLTYDSESKAAILLPHLAALKNNVKVLRLRAVAELQNDQPQLAVADVTLGLYLVNAIRTERFLISQLVRISMLEIALQPVWEGLADCRWSNSQLMAMDEELATFNLLADARNTLGSEISFVAEEIDFMRRHRDYAAQFTQMGVNHSDRFKIQFAVYRFMPGGWFYQSALKHGRSMTEYLPAIDLESKTISPVFTRRADSMANHKVSIFDPLEGMRKMFDAGDFFLGNFLKRIAAGQVSVNLARTAIALERYRLVHGDYPESLDTLAPQFVAQVPNDVFGRQPLQYRREGKRRFVLYSVGWNEADDGGMLVFKNNSSTEVDFTQGDWVWRYPAK